MAGHTLRPELVDAIKAVVADTLAQDKSNYQDDPNVKRFLDVMRGGAPPDPAPLNGEAHMGQPGMKLARYARAYALVKGNPADIPVVLRDVYGDETMAKAHESFRERLKSDQRFRAKALDTQTPTAGGYLVPVEYSAEIIPVLRELTFLYELGATKYPMNKPIVNIPRLDVATLAAYFGERQAVPSGQPTFGNVELKEKRLGALVPISNDLLESSDPAADAVVKQDLTLSMALKRDQKALDGEGNTNIPVGLKNSGIPNLSIGALLLPTDPPKFIQKVLQKKKKILRGGWVFPSLVWMALINMMTTTGAFIYREEMTKNGIMSGTLMGYPYAVNDQIAIGGDGHGMTDIYFGDWSEFIVGERGLLELAMSTEASFKDAGGNQHNAFEENLTLIRAIDKHDFAVRHVESFVVASNVWTR